MTGVLHVAHIYLYNFIGSVNLNGFGLKGCGHISEDLVV